MIFTENRNRCLAAEARCAILPFNRNRKMDSNDQLITCDTDKTLDQACADLEAAVAKHQFGVMTTHDLKQTMQKKGVDFARECRIFEVCNPHQAKKVLEANIEISTALPCRISVYEEDDKVRFSTVRPTAMIGLFGAEGTEAVAREVEETMTAIMEDAATIED